MNLWTPTRLTKGQIVRFIDKQNDHAEWVVSRVSEEWVYLHLSTDVCYTHFAKPAELCVVTAPQRENT